MPCLVIVPVGLSYRHLVIWAELCPHKAFMLKSYLPVSENGTLFGDRIFKDVIKLKWGYQGGL